MEAAQKAYYWMGKQGAIGPQSRTMARGLEQAAKCEAQNYFLEDERGWYSWEEAKMDPQEDIFFEEDFVPKNFLQEFSKYDVHLSPRHDINSELGLCEEVNLDIFDDTAIWDIWTWCLFFVV